MFAYIGASPFVLQQIYGLSPQAFSFCFALNGLGLIIASQTSARLSPYFGEYRVLKGGLTLAFVASLSLLIAAVFFDQHTLNHLAPALLPGITATLAVIFLNMLVISSQHLRIDWLVTVFMHQDFPG